MAKNKRTVKITDDPAKSLPIGSGFDVRFWLYPPVIPRGAGALREWEHFGTALLAVMFVESGQKTVQGSGVLIAPGLALAAKHVFDPVWERLVSGEVECGAFSITPDGSVFWRVHQIHHFDTDVVILALNLASEPPKAGLRCAVLTTRTPAAAEPVMIVGVRSEGSSALADAHDIAVRVGVGEVGEVHATGRDRLLLPDPSFEVACLTIGGMSGGPAFDREGKLVGILSRSWETEENEGPSYVSFWWPAAGKMIDQHWLPGLITEPTNLLGLNEKGLVRIERADALETGPPTSDNMTVTYHAWS